MSSPAVTVSRRAIERVRHGHPWIERGEVAAESGGLADGALCTFGDGRRRLGCALWSAHSKIALRILTRDENPLDEAGLLRLIEERIERAISRRGPFREAMAPGDAYRAVHGEADLLPGLFVDRYGDAAVLQTACAGMDAREPAIAGLVAKRLGVKLVIARNDGSARDFEGLPRRSGVVHGAGATVARYHDAGSAMEVDLLGGATEGPPRSRKTGAFLDQQENHARAGEYARAIAASVRGGEALDAFSYHGGFALAIARAGLRVTALDEDPDAIARARSNAERNRVSITAHAGNAFDALRGFEAEGRRFHLVVLDPPSLARRGGGGPGGASAAREKAERAYKELNLRGLRLLHSGGVLITCSCSGKLPAERFGRIVEAAAADVGRPLQLLERRGAGRDHPPLVGVAETDYLKCWIVRAVD